MPPRNHITAVRIFLNLTAVTGLQERLTKGKALAKQKYFDISRKGPAWSV